MNVEHTSTEALTIAIYSGAASTPIIFYERCLSALEAPIFWTFYAGMLPSDWPKGCAVLKHKHLKQLHGADSNVPRKEPLKRIIASISKSNERWLLISSWTE